MKLFSILSAFLLFSLSLSACVTTRDQLNQQRGISGESSPDQDAPANHEKPVQSEDLKQQRAANSAPTEKAPVEKSAMGKTVPPMTAEAPATAASAAPAAAVTAPAAASAVPPISEPAAAPAAAPITAAAVAPISEPAAAPVTAPIAAAVAAATPPAASAASATLLKGDLSKYSDDELRVEITRLAGRVEELEHDQQIKDQAHQDEAKKANDHIAELEKKLKELQPDTPTLPSGLTPLAAGKQAFMDGKYDDAVAFTSQVLEKQDTGKDAEEATYLRGEAYFKKQQYNKAIVDFSHFPEKFQKSTYHPKALLRIAECFQAMGRKDDAKAFYSDLADKFPKTAEGKLAKKRMKSRL